MKIGAVIIGQHEEALIGRMLESVKGLDGIYFTYTGDTEKPDGTLEIVKKFTQNISYFRWCDDFSAARNAAKRAVPPDVDWLLSIDCDEILQDVAAVREAVALAEQRQAKSVDCRLITENQDGHWFWFPRLYKNVPDVQWESPIHNVLNVPSEKVGNVRITVGYSPAHNTDPDRAFRILKKDVETRFHPRSMYYLGREYWYRKDFENTVITLGKYVQVSGFLAEKADAFLIMARSYWAMGMPDDARDACVQALICNANFKEAILFMAILAGKGSKNPRWEENARQWEQMAKTATNDDVLFVRGENE